MFLSLLYDILFKLLQISFILVSYFIYYKYIFLSPLLEYLLL